MWNGAGAEPGPGAQPAAEAVGTRLALDDLVSGSADANPASAALDRVIASVRSRSGLVVTHGYGPRYQHSTGQLHKGGPNTGLFLQVIDDQGDELPIPGKPFGFRRLIRAQAAGDLETLKERGRRVARLRLEDL